MKRRPIGPAALLLCVVVGLAACKTEEPQSIIVLSNQVTVFNRTAERWTHVDVWLNNHYRAQAPELLPGGRLDVPITVFIAGFGQRFDPKKQSPFGIEVEAQADKSGTVRLAWGQGRRR